MRDERALVGGWPAAPVEENGAAVTKWPDNVFEVSQQGRVVILNPASETLFLVQEDPAVRCELVLEVIYQGRVGIYYRVVISELHVRVLVEPKRERAAIGTLPPHVVKAERFIIPEAFEDHFLKGRQGVVIHLDGLGLIAGKVMQSSHDSSPSVGAPAGAVRDTSNPTEGDLNTQGESAQ